MSSMRLNCKALQTRHEITRDVVFTLSQLFQPAEHKQHHAQRSEAYSVSMRNVAVFLIAASL